MSDEASNKASVSPLLRAEDEEQELFDAALRRLAREEGNGLEQEDDKAEGRR